MTEQGAISALVAETASYLGAYYKLDYTTNSQIVKAISNTYNKFEKKPDVIWFDMLEIPNNINLKNCSININIFGICGSSNKINLDLHFLTKICETFTFNDKIVIKLDEETFFDKTMSKNIEEPLLTYVYKGFALINKNISYVTFSIESNDRFEYNLYTKNYYLQTELRKKVSDLYGGIYHMKLYNKYRISGSLISTGFFLTIKEPLESLQFRINNNYLFMDYNELQVNMYCKKIYEKDTWTEKHITALFDSLENIIGLDITNEINLFMEANKYAEYTYWIPFVPNGTTSNCKDSFNNTYLDWNRFDNIHIKYNDKQFTKFQDLDIIINERTYLSIQ